MRRVCHPAIALALLAAGCSGGTREAPEKAQETASVEARVAEPRAGQLDRIEVTVQPKSGAGLSGTVVVTRQQKDVINLSLKLVNAPEGKHAVHLHEFGDCTAEDASSAGAHWNPTGAEHGPWGSPSFHLGDVGNIPVYPDGTGSLQIVTKRWTLGTGESNDIVGKALIVHELEDDFVTQPTGAAGGRIGCAVIEP
jgi:Cu-Zn family superoxide dismutase